MLTNDFLNLLENAEPHRPVTGIVTWKVPARGVEPELDYTANMDALLKAARAFRGARVNSLKGTYQAILEVPAEGWRQLIDSPEMHFAGPNLRVEANVPAFSTLPEPR